MGGGWRKEGEQGREGMGGDMDGKEGEGEEGKEDRGL